MRVISGKYKGKKLEGFDIEGTRPTMDRVKESVFGIIQNNLRDSVCLDLFAGSGSLGIEALSNGANKCYFIDNSDKIIPILKNNIKTIENAIFVKNDFKSFLANTKEKFDVIFLDPPYKYNLIQESLNLIIQHNLLKEDGIIICEYENEKFNCDLEVIKEKKYGSKNIRIYRK